jgi:sugar phosphate isomerase/epimerase
MTPKLIKDTSRLCIHTITTKPWSLDEVIKNYHLSDVRGVTVWRQALEGRNPVQIGKQIREKDMSIVSLCRGGFFPAVDNEARQRAIDENLRAIDEAAELGAPLLVLVCGADPGLSLEISRQQIVDGIQAVLPHAEASGVKLGIEPLHPMYADTRSAINTLHQANQICDQIDSPWVGVVVDVYHLWWDSDLERQIQYCGENDRIFAFHISDWKTPTNDFLNDRGLMGEGCIPIKKIRSWVERSGFDGWIEVEIFSNHYWEKDQSEFLNQVIQAYLKYA